MAYQQPPQRVTKDALLKTASVMAGQKAEHMQHPWASHRFMAFSLMLENVVLPATGHKKDEFPNVFRVIENAIGISEHKGVSNASEQSKWNLQVAANLQGEDYTKRPFLFRL